jgi:hypothetical protein
LGDRQLIKLAEHFGVPLDNISDHFKPEPPHNPLVLRGHSSGFGRNKKPGPIIKKYERTETIERLEADIRELNDFLARCNISGGEHHGYTRNFNNASWKKGGRLYSVGGGYQQMSPPEKRLQMTINGEAVAEIDIKASHLTIYHAKLKCPPKTHQWTRLSHGGAIHSVCRSEAGEDRSTFAGQDNLGDRPAASALPLDHGREFEADQ